MSEFMAAITAALEKFESDLVFTAPEIWHMRVQQLRERITEIALDHDHGPGSGE